jgi:hypothetical protein
MIPLGRPRLRWKYIKSDVKEIVFEDMYWIYLAQNMEGLVVGSCEYGDEFWVPYTGIS